MTNKKYQKTGLSCSRFWNIWRAIKQRCTQDKQINFERYGKIGIIFDKKWDIFTNFRDDMYESYLEHIDKYGEKNTQIDRIDNNGNYCKENCRWATIKEQARNKKNNLNIYFRGERHCLKEWSEIIGISYMTLYLRMQRRHWSIEKTLNTPKLS